jgi:PBP1b-binding outer membrane lipoprotein LpoB
MKRILCVLSSVVILAACNNAADSNEEVKDSVMETIDSAGDARVDSVKEATDSLENKVENTFDKTDSANKAVADSAKH